MSAPSPAAQQKTIRKTAIVCACLVASMLGLAFASVPLYNLFCRVTGFDGTPMVATQEAATTGARTIRVRFDANVAPGLPWRFAAETQHADIRPGETKTILFKAVNLARGETNGVATFNVYPPLAAQYFNKLQCFCFNETPLKAGQEIEVPVVFFLDPELEKNPDLNSLKEITLSYTFFAAKNGKPVAAAPASTSLQ
jgi:cytochrome c oxidase assembly protein subunit 11